MYHTRESKEKSNGKMTLNGGEVVIVVQHDDDNDDVVKTENFFLNKLLNNASTDLMLSLTEVCMESHFVRELSVRLHKK
jgi:hypothetical protein